MCHERHRADALHKCGIGQSQIQLPRFVLGKVDPDSQTHNYEVCIYRLAKQSRPNERCEIFVVRGPPPIHSIKNISRRRTLARPSLVSSGHVNRTGPLCWSRPGLIMSLGCRREQTGARLKRSCVVDHAWAWPTHAVRRPLILFMKALIGGWPFGQP